jgi:hypothetical protein
MYARKFKKGRSRFKQRLFIGLVVLIAGFFILPKAWHWGMAKYAPIKQERALRQASEYLAAKNPSAAAAAINVALMANPGSVAAWRKTADLVESTGANEALAYRRRVIEMEPNNPENILALTKTAFRLGDSQTMQETLVALPNELKRSPEVLRMVLALSLQYNAAPIADALYDQLDKVQPKDPDLTFQHAVLLMRHPKEAKAIKARQTVMEMGAKSEYRLASARALFVDALGRIDKARILELSKQLSSDPQAGFGDKLSAANGVLSYGARPVQDIIKEFSVSAATNPTDAVQFAQWLRVQKRDEEASAWIESLPKALSDSPQVLAWKTERAIQLGRNEEFADLLGKGAWGTLKMPAIDLAFTAKLVAKNQDPALKAGVWRDALDKAEGDLSTLVALSRLSALWSWQKETLETLTVIAERYPSQLWAHEARINLCRTLKSTSGMHAALQSWRRFDPRSERLRYNLALLELLLKTVPTRDEDPAKLELERLLALHPNEASYITSAAFALALSGRTDESVALIDKLPAEAMQLPQRAPYIAYINALAQRYEVAALQIKKARQVDLLPEELRLVDLADESVRKRKS